MAFCTNCGTQLDEGTTFCTNCGTKNGTENTGSGPVIGGGSFLEERLPER